MRLLIDSWGWMAALNRREPLHGVAVAIVEQAIEKRGAYTTNFVLAEFITLAFVRYKESGGQILDDLLNTLASPGIHIEEITPARFQSALALRKRYHDKPYISFFDLSSMVVMQELRITDILTEDQHFAKVNLGFTLLPKMR